MNNFILKEEMILYFWFKLNKKHTSAALKNTGGMFPISLRIELEKGVEASNSATNWKGYIYFNLIPKSEGGVGFNISQKIELSIG